MEIESSLVVHNACVRIGVGDVHGAADVDVGERVCEAIHRSVRKLDTGRESLDVVPADLYPGCPGDRDDALTTSATGVTEVVTKDCDVGRPGTKREHGLRVGGHKD